VRGEGNSRDTSHHRTQGDAIERAREIARNERSEVVIHDRRGRIGKDSYGRTHRGTAGTDGPRQKTRRDTTWPPSGC
jgi:Uncharacterized protein conserved in bacteria (DUF2188)